MKVLKKGYVDLSKVNLQSFSNDDKCIIFTRLLRDICSWEEVFFLIQQLIQCLFLVLRDYCIYHGILQMCIQINWVHIYNFYCFVWILEKLTVFSRKMEYLRFLMPIMYQTMFLNFLGWKIEYMNLSYKPYKASLSFLFHYVRKFPFSSKFYGKLLQSNNIKCRCNVYVYIHYLSLEIFKPTSR